MHKKTLLPDFKNSKILLRFFTAELKKVYWIEKTKINVLNKLIDQVDAINIMLDLEDNLVLTRRKLKTLTSIFNQLDVSPGTITHPGVKSIYSEIERNVLRFSRGIVKDAAIQLNIQQLIHFEIGTFTILMSIARSMSQKKIAFLLLKMLLDEKDSLVEFTKLAEDLSDNQ